MPTERPRSTVVLTGRITPDDVPRVCARVTPLIEAGHLIVVDVMCAEAATIGVIDALARLQLAARRAGAELEIVADEHVTLLLEMTGLGAAVPVEER